MSIRNHFLTRIQHQLSLNGIKQAFQMPAIQDTETVGEVTSVHLINFGMKKIKSATLEEGNNARSFSNTNIN